ncbi:hypothetical protein C1645_817671 [Glomus cerebriforme]|uniref:Myb-like domain-containing protein n=1 Tax=Glomus cerebriforme TaxID=658196 RepID=A0A397TE65_9GLOM|nr:hypothetical protein C1645_817671 [Glomus cerebriforme]
MKCQLTTSLEDIKLVPIDKQQFGINTNSKSQIKDELKMLDKTIFNHEKDWNRFWTKGELKILYKGVLKHGKDWEYISKEYFQAKWTPLTLSKK